MRTIHEWARRVPARLQHALPIAVLIAVVTYAAYWWIEVRPPDKFEPITLAGLRVTSETVQAGTQGTVINGFCIEADEPVAVEIYVGMQRMAEDQLIAGEVIDLQKTTEPLDPGCIAINEPLTFDVPIHAEPGMWRLFMRLTAEAPHGRIQNADETSNTFEVTR